MENKNIALGVLEKELKTKKTELLDIQKQIGEENHVIYENLNDKYIEFFLGKIPELRGSEYREEEYGKMPLRLVLGKDYQIKSYRGETIEFQLASEDRFKEIFRVYLEKSDYQLNNPDKVRLNYYTTFCDSDFEFKRLAILGKFAEKLRHKEYQQELLDIYCNKPNTTLTYSDMCKVEREIGEIKTQISKLKREAKYYSFETEGVLMKKTPYGKYPDIEYKNGNSIYKCKSMQLVKYTNDSKKTATVKFVKEITPYDGDSYDESVTIDKVRVSTIEDILNYDCEDVC